MAYDEELADRVRAQLPAGEAITEKRMFGGLAFMLGGNMAVGVRGDGLLVRVGPDGAQDALAQPHASIPVMGSRAMSSGWIAVDAAGVATDPAVAAWIQRGVSFARTLPPKD
jgi:TfoX/Sxy family transcriptional regulator of competence genes